MTTPGASMPERPVQEHRRNSNTKDMPLPCGRPSEIGVAHSIATTAKTRQGFSWLSLMPGDIDLYCAATAYASELMGSKATRALETMCAGHWRRQSTNPNGYA